MISKIILGRAKIDEDKNNNIKLEMKEKYIFVEKMRRKWTFDEVGIEAKKGAGGWMKESIHQIRGEKWSVGEELALNPF